MDNMYRLAWSRSPGHMSMVSRVTRPAGRLTISRSIAIGMFLSVAFTMGLGASSDVQARKFASDGSTCISNTGDTAVGRIATPLTDRDPMDGSGTYSTVAGCNADGNGQLAATVYGTFSKVTGRGGSAFGFLSETSKWASALGLESAATGTGGAAVGFGSRATALNSIAIGSAAGDGANPLTVEDSTIASGRHSIAIGANDVRGAQASGVAGIAIGGEATASAVSAVATGSGAMATADGTLALGAGAMAKDAHGVALGANSVTAPVEATSEVTINGQTYVVAGSDPASTVSVGDMGAERTVTNVAAGRVSADSTDAVNGSQLHATNQVVGQIGGRVIEVEGDVKALGDRVTNVEGGVSNISNDLAELDDQAVKYDTSDDGSVDYDTINLNGDDGTTITNLGDGEVSADSSDAVNGGQLWEVKEKLTNIEVGETTYFKANSEAVDARAEGAESVAMGPESVAAGDDSVAVGNGARAESDGGVALGAGSQATREGMNGAEEAFSNESVASTQGAVSVGSEGGERQISHVAGGTEDMDAVNVRQLEAVQTGSVNYDRHEDGGVDYSSVTLGHEGTSTRIRNVAPGEALTDAANVGQLQELNQQFNQQIGGLSNRIDDVEDDANAGTASAIATASVPQAYLPGKSMVSAGAGTYSGESAVAVGVSRLSDNGRWAVKLNASGDSQGNFGTGIGAGFHW
ncbi:hypothetical protein FZZ93_07575 [Halomonas eurihalina]|uniref:Uncharacterized protein n=1 Tax=Halomonas eurihalina TaxID=42566 RepID=A0A5D9D907_HALER|nr:YadA family autotransporter adhesin [Halomonas eurihalina]MDR5860678.1 YadA family autotransporter adhesin [Halomonas eurihalina]TZG40099.1 hypothetical protein FZZ93_07575 [Halomonas eurihalina]